MKTHWYSITFPDNEALVDTELYLNEIFQEIGAYHKEYDPAKFGDYGKVEVYTHKVTLTIYIQTKRADYLGALKRYVNKQNYSLESCANPSTALTDLMQIITFE